MIRTKHAGATTTAAVGAAVLAGAVIGGPAAQPAAAEAAAECQGSQSADTKAKTTSSSGQGRGGTAWDAGLALGSQDSETSRSAEIAECSRTVWKERYPGYNVMVIQQETYDGPTFIDGVQEQAELSIGSNSWDVWVFEEGSFTNDGDMGAENWDWSGAGWTRSEDLRTVTFTNAFG